MLPVPGYEHKVEFGVLVHFAYPVEDSGTRSLFTMITGVSPLVRPKTLDFKGKYCIILFSIVHYGVVLSGKDLVCLTNYGGNAVSTYALIEDTSLSVA